MFSFSSNSAVTAKACAIALLVPEAEVKLAVTALANGMY